MQNVTNANITGSQINSAIKLSRAKKAGIGVLIAFNVLVIAAAIDSADPLSIIIAFAVLESIIVLPVYAIGRYVKRRKVAKQVKEAPKAEPEASHVSPIHHSNEKVKDTILTNKQPVQPKEPPKRISCPQCGAQFDGRAQFCSVCGERFGSKQMNFS